MSKEDVVTLDYNMILLYCTAGEASIECGSYRGRAATEGRGVEQTA